MIHVTPPPASCSLGAVDAGAGHGNPPPEPAISRRTLLVVDDDPDILELMRFALEGEGYTVLCASSGHVALDLLRTGAQVSLILLDLMMPGMDGWRFVEELTQLQGSESPPIVVLSAASHRAIPPGVACFLRKPVDLRDLFGVAARYSRNPDER
jgi:CheY-like chemotaxis protein